MAYSLQGLNNYISAEISKIYWLNKIYPPEIRLAHTEETSTSTISASCPCTASDGTSMTFSCRGSRERRES